MYHLAFSRDTFQEAGSISLAVKQNQTQSDLSNFFCCCYFIETERLLHVVYVTILWILMFHEQLTYYSIFKCSKINIYVYHFKIFNAMHENFREIR